MKASLKKWITGISIPQEYVCIGLRDIHHTLSVSVTFPGKNDSADITGRHLFLGYKPVVMAIIFNKDEAVETKACLHFHQGTFEINSAWKGFATSSNCVARLLIERVESKLAGEHKIVFYRGVEGTHTLISFVHQRLNAFLERHRRRPEGNVQLSANLYEQVRIAYSIPRVISLITVYDDRLMNLFPTDLHGVIGRDFYAGSLRIDGEACKQVEKYRRIALSEIDASQFRKAYALGKRHMKPMSDPQDFDLDPQRSVIFRFPLPWGVGVYRELEVADHFDVGIHRIFIYKIIHESQVADMNVLSHIHCYYAQWRINRKLNNNYLLR